MNLLLTIPYHAKDAQLTIRLLEWIEALGQSGAGVPLGSRGVSAMIASDAASDAESRMQIKELAKRIFLHSEMILVNVPEQNQGWPKGPNRMFHEASRQIQECYRLPFLWLEPDAVPLKPSWFEELCSAYENCPKRFMGHIVQSSAPNLPPVHMAGVGIYPQNAHSMLKQFTMGADAFDVASGHFMCGEFRTTHTPLIHHIWGDHTTSPVFAEIKTADNVLTLDAIPKEAVLFHRCKDASLINALKNVGKAEVKPVPVLEPELIIPAEEPKRGPGRPKKVLQAA